jgi:catechol 2,3-dioxygenase-like lactoylglutathione lyase family enzyme
MLITHLFHIAIKTPDLEATRRFYTELLGMQLAARPEMAFPGLWIKAPTLGGDAILHFYGGWAAKDRAGNVPVGTSAIDHVALAAIGYHELRDRLKAVGLSHRENKVPEVPVWQIFVHDPSGVLLEISFNLDAENQPYPEIESKFQYTPGEVWFDSEEYRQFSDGAHALG